MYGTICTCKIRYDTETRGKTNNPKYRVRYREGHLEVLQLLRKNDCPWDEWTCREAAEGGHLEVLQWARENGCDE